MPESSIIRSWKFWLAGFTVVVLILLVVLFHKTSPPHTPDQSLSLLQGNQTKTAFAGVAVILKNTHLLCDLIV